jgi:hypothetical protein
MGTRYILKQCSYLPHLVGAAPALLLYACGAVGVDSLNSSVLEYHL